MNTTHQAVEAAEHPGADLTAKEQTPLQKELAMAKALAKIDRAEAALTLPQEVAAEVGNAEISLLELISELEDAAAEYAHEMSGRAELDKLVACRAKVSDAVRLLSGLAASRSPAPAGGAGGVDAVWLRAKTAMRPENAWEVVAPGSINAIPYVPATQAQPSPHPAVGGSGGDVGAVK